MLTHPATDDPDRLLAATKCVVAEWAADDYYVDEVALGADPRVVGSRLALLYAVVDPAAAAGAYAPQLDEYRREEPIATAFRTAMEHLARYASDDADGPLSAPDGDPVRGVEPGGRLAPQRHGRRRSGSTSCSAISTATCRR